MAQKHKGLDEFKDVGLLWAINRYIFHPRGLALTFQFEEDGTVSEWWLQGDGSEVWTFPEDMDDENFIKFNEFLGDALNDPS